MASHPGGPHNFPYAYRVGVPWLVHVLPFSHVTSFTLVAWLAIAASGAALYALLGEFDIADRLSIALAVGFVLSPPLLVVLIRHGRSIDPASILVMMLGTLFIVRRQKLALLDHGADRDDRPRVKPVPDPVRLRRMGAFTVRP